MTKQRRGVSVLKMFRHLGVNNKRLLTNRRSRRHSAFNARASYSHTSRRRRYFAARRRLYLHLSVNWIFTQATCKWCWSQEAKVGLAASSSPSPLLLLPLVSFLPLFLRPSFFSSSFHSSPPLISFLLPPSLLPPPRPLSVISSADGAPQWQAAEAVATATRGDSVCGSGSILSVVGRGWGGGCKWNLHTIACCSLVSGWRGSDNQILNSEDAELLLCHHIEKSVCIFSLDSLHYRLGLHIFHLCHHNNMK